MVTLIYQKKKNRLGLALAMDPSNVKLNGIVSEVTDVMTTTGSSLKLAKMLRAEKRKQQAKMHQNFFIDNH